MLCHVMLCFRYRLTGLCHQFQTCALACINVGYKSKILPKHHQILGIFNQVVKALNF